LYLKLITIIKENNYEQRNIGQLPVVKRTFGYMTVLFNSIGRMPFLAPSLGNAYLLFALVITLGLYLQHVEMADQDPAGDRESTANKFDDGQLESL